MKMLKKIITILVIVIALSMLFCPIYLLAGGLIDDDASYVSHAFTIGLDFDLDYNNEIAYDSCMSPNGKVPCHPMGPGLMAAPFVALFSLVDRIADAPVIEDHIKLSYSWSYFGFMFSACFYFFTGVWLYASLIERVGSLPRSANLLFASGFGVLHYVFYRFTMGHAFEFFALAVVLWASVLMWQSSKEGRINFRADVICSIGIVLVLLIRPANINVFIMPPLAVCMLWLSERPGDSEPLRGVIRNGLVIAGALSVLLIPIIMFYVFAYGTVYPTIENMYGGRGSLPSLNNASDVVATIIELIKLMPYIPQIIFSSEYGLLYTSPIFIFGLVPFFYAPFVHMRRNPLLALCMIILLLIYVGLPVSIVLFCRQVASGYGYRYLFSLYPVALLGYCVWYHKVSSEEEKKKLRNKIIHGTLVTLSIYALLGQMFYGVTDRLIARQQKNVFGIIHPYSARGYSTALATALIDPLAWRNLVHVRLPGFIARDVIRVNLRKYGTALNFYDSEIETMVQNYSIPPFAVAVQVAILICFCIIISNLYIVRPPPQRDKFIDKPSIKGGPAGEQSS